jgi:hypothetical protein
MLAKHRWIVERDYLELKQELGLGHFEGRSWRGVHHHTTLCIAAYGFLVAERSFSPLPRAGKLSIARVELPAGYRPRGTRRGCEGCMLTQSRPKEVDFLTDPATLILPLL